MMKVGTANVRELYFEQQDLTRINGKPTFAVIHNMVLQLKSNTVSVLCTLGGGAYRYIGIILPPVTYIAIAPMNILVVPAPPGPLNVANKTKQYQITHTTNLHETSTHTFYMYQLVQHTIIQYWKL